MHRKTFIKAASLGSMLLLTQAQALTGIQALMAAPARRKRVLRIAIASDLHFGQPNTPFDQNAQNLVTHVNEAHAADPFAFCVINGDLIHDDPAHLPLARKALQGLAMPYYVSQGNHDRVTPEYWQQVWGMPLNYDWRTGKQAFIIASTSNKQGDYLAPDLTFMQAALQRQAKAREVFIFLHINPAGIASHSVNSEALKTLLAKHKNVKAVFNGHDHNEAGIHTAGHFHYLFTGHAGGNWGLPYYGYRVLELFTDGSMLTYMMNPREAIGEQRIG